jgi:DNA repair protein RadC
VSTEIEPPSSPLPIEDLLLEDLLVLVSGTARARDLFSRHGVRGVQTLSQVEAVAEGLSPGGARRLVGAFELARRLAERQVVRGAPFTSSGQVFEAFHGRLRHLRHEQTWLVLLDAKNRVQREVMLSQGSLTGSPVHPRELFRLAIREAAVSIVLVHNHPSGDPEPSPEDQDLTRRLQAVGELVGIRIVDHIVVGDGSYVSFLERGWIQP